MSTSSRPVGLVSVNTAPERAKKVLGEVCERVKPRYNIEHVGNADTIGGLEPLLKSLEPKPGIVFCASMWTPEQQQEIKSIARSVLGDDFRFYGIPTGLQVKVGPQGIVEHILENIDGVMAQ
ncbi:hypothetical protein DMC30DRAFT_415531 [Rhodotorula diobovata]|uniref:Uncharacterized protein n=1 Tax=Rhodotorula diobovata TaxID=5288 RepID=A0A5C5FYT5_9BASI|nr:hypothetical protein DMC30DRAFT_415531 [Rhodotorula diobovata]